MSVCLYTTSIYIYIPGTQMTLALIGKGLLLKGATPKTKDKQVPGIYIYIPRIYYLPTITSSWVSKVSYFVQSPENIYTRESRCRTK